MKKLKKLCLLVASVFGSFGIVLCIVGLVLGGSSASAITNGFLGNPFIHIWGGGTESVYEEADAVVTYEQAYVGEDDDMMPYKFTSASVKALDIELDFGSLNVYLSEDDSIYVHLNGGDGHCELRNGTLELNKLTADEVTVYVPENHIFDSIDIESEVGTIYADTALKSSGHAEISTDAGEISIMDIEAQSLGVSAETGMIMIEHSFIHGNTELEANAGSIEYWADGESSHYNYIISTETGSVFVDDENLSGFSQKRTIDNGASRKITAEADAGNINIYFS